jgi:hypothetical protein
MRRSRGLGDVYKRQVLTMRELVQKNILNSFLMRGNTKN